ncbi:MULTISPECIES: tRNA lysidine(34) synthetase TilS [unclassified Bilifractor]|uniref:tRNA lysidine(34) synthetase TilS n=1 Tax=unclassified Bilifractor TaxID=2815795 RepID=UPI003F93C362
MDLIKEADAYIRRFHMIDEGDVVIAGVSGGADSVCLLLVLNALREKRSFHLAAVHVNHNIRGADADADEEYVRTICRERKIPLYVYSFPVTEIARQEKRGLEETGRLLRQQAFRDALCKAERLFLSEETGERADNPKRRRVTEVRGRGGAAEGVKIALAHHANDLAETALFQAVRGSSLAGLAGIRPVSRIGGAWEEVDAEGPTSSSGYSRDNRDMWEDARTKGPTASSSHSPGNRVAWEDARREELTVIHPLLFVRRWEIEEWLQEQNICWRTDATNLDEEYSRNCLRQRVIPYLEEHLNPEAVRHIRELAEDAAEADEYLHAEARKRESELVEVGSNSDGGVIVFLKDAVMQEAEVIQRYILMDALEMVSGRKKDLGREQLQQLRELFGMSAGKGVDLPYGVRAVRRYDGIRLVRGDADLAQSAAVPVTGEGTFFFRGWRFTCRQMRGYPGAEKKIPLNRYTKYFDYDKIGNNIVFRTRLAGDRIVVTDTGQTKKLKDYFINEKIPRDERGGIPLLASGQRIFWVVGGRISGDCRITDKTKNILEITAEEMTCQ